LDESVIVQEQQIAAAREFGATVAGANEPHRFVKRLRTSGVSSVEQSSTTMTSYGTDPEFLMTDAIAL
jgi:hypothetical protein